MADKPVSFETTVPGRPAVMDVLHEHVAEVAYLTIQWRKLLFSPEIPFRRLRGHSERIEAHLDGLRVGGPASLRVAEAKLEGDDPWVVYAAARIWMELGHPPLEVVHKRLQKSPPELLAAWCEVFRKLPPAVVARIFPESILENLPAGLLQIATDALGWHGLLLPATAARFAGLAEVGVRRAVARHAVQPSLIVRLLEDENAIVRRSALWSLSLQDPRAALDRSRQIAAAPQPDAFALRVIGLLGDMHDGMQLLSLLRQESMVPDALSALRELGRPDCAETLLELMEGDDADQALAAKDVFESLVGHIPGTNSTPQATAGITPARNHWQQVRKSLDHSKRMLHGQPFPWVGASADEPMKWVWRRILPGAPAEFAWLRREVPDGFFADRPAEEAIPGE